MLTFDDLLTLEGVDLAQVRLVRHRDNRLRPGHAMGETTSKAVTRRLTGV